MNLKDPGKGHFYVSLVKSGLRIGAGVCLYYALPGNLLLMGTAVLLMLAEALGILEELV